MPSIFLSQLAKRQPLACRILDQAVARHQLSHAYLLTGYATSDKYLLSRFLSCYLNCEHKDTEGHCLVRNTNDLDRDMQLPSTSEFCRNCRWIWMQAHPQAWLKLSGEESKSGRIAVEKARMLAVELSKESPYARTILIPDATRECFHAPAANALLKTIEEPSSNSLFLLFAPDAASVLSTIVSRCQIIPLVQTFSSIFRFPSKDEDKGEVESFQKTKDSEEELQAAISKYQNPPSTIAEAMQWAAELELATDDGVDSHLLVDWIVFKKFEQLRNNAAEDPSASAYLDRLISLAQTTKDQLDKYVQPKAAFESFALNLVNI